MRLVANGTDTRIPADVTTCKMTAAVCDVRRLEIPRDRARGREAPLALDITLRYATRYHDIERLAKRL